MQRLNAAPHRAVAARRAGSSGIGKGTGTDVGFCAGAPTRRALTRALQLVLVWVLSLGALGQAAWAGSYDDFFRAITQNDAAAVRALLARGFDANTVDESGQPALHRALRLGAFDVAQLLVDAPAAQIDVRNASDETPLMLAALKGQRALVQRLLALGADVNKPGWAPLHYAATAGHVGILDDLLQAHAYIDAESPNASTPLMMAAGYGNPSAVKALLEAGADPTLKNQLGLSALDFARQGPHADSVEIVRAFLRARSGSGW